VAAIIDRYSRRVLNLGCYADQPNSRQIQKLLERTIREVRAKPKYIVCDRGAQFDCPAFRRWCRRRKIKPPRYGAIGKHGSIALVERLIRTLKEFCRSLPVVPRERKEFVRELKLFQAWFNEHRPHDGLGGKTPNEQLRLPSEERGERPKAVVCRHLQATAFRFEKRFPANRKPHYEQPKPPSDQRGRRLRAVV
jgi:transposase InsO family protein